MSDKVNTRQVRIADILVYPRIRKKARQITELAADIREHGLINPITIMDTGNGAYVLIAGQRRLEAVVLNDEHTIRSTVLSPMDADAALALEYAENEQRQDITVSERLEYAEKIKAVEQAKAKERKQLFAGGRDPELPLKSDLQELHVPKRAHVETGRTRQIVADKAGFTSATQYERAATVAEKKPELLDKIDRGETTIYGAYREVTEQKRQEPEPVGEEPNDASPPPLPADQVARAKHERLMKNPLYAELYAKHREAVQEANRAKGDRDFKIMCSDKVIRGHEENIQYMRRMIDGLRAENTELRRRLGLSEDEPIDVTTTIDNQGGNPT